MERAANLVKNHRDSRRIFDDSDLVNAVWATAVGTAIARHTGRIKLVRDKVVVEVADAVWQKQLHGLSSQIVMRLQKCMRSAVVREIEFRIGVPRREPERSAIRTSNNSSSKAMQDEAEAIQDPLLKKIYLLSRKKSTA